MFSFIHAADIHLDSPLVGLARYEDAPVQELRLATRQAFINLVDLAVDRKVAFVLLAGDLYDGDWKDYNTGLFFAKQMARLKEASIRVFIVAGNHDAANPFTRSLRTTENVHRFSTTHAETIVLDDLSVAIHGRSFHAKAVQDNLAAGFPHASSGLFNIGLLHTSLNGREGHAPYAPCSIDELIARHYQYWALGHVHSREIVMQNPWVVFPGNTQGRHVRELGAKGCTLVTVRDGDVAEVSEQHVDVLRWCVCKVDIAGAATEEELFECVSRPLEKAMSETDGRVLAIRLVLSGPTRMHGMLMAQPELWQQRIRTWTIDRCGDGAWLEKIAFSTGFDATRQSWQTGQDPFSGFLRTIREMCADESLIDELKHEFMALRGRLPGELCDPEGLEPLDPTSTVLLQEVLAEARDLLVTRLSSEGR